MGKPCHCNLAFCFAFDGVGSRMTEKRIGTGLPGPGRKKLAIPNERITVRMNKDQFAEFKRLGGSKWLAGVLDKIKEARDAQGE